MKDEIVEAEEVTESKLALPKIVLTPKVKKVLIIVGVSAGVVAAGYAGYKLAGIIGEGAATDLVETIEASAFTATSNGG